MRKFLLVLLASAASLVAVDATGNWRGTLTHNGSSGGPALVILKQSGDTLTGSAGADENDRHDIRNGRITGDKVTFEAGGGSGLSFELILKGDDLSGTISREREGQRQTAILKLKREK